MNGIEKQVCTIVYLVTNKKLNLIRDQGISLT